MASERPTRHRVSWTKRANRRLMDMLEDARRAEGNPDWVLTKYEECWEESDSRLGTFPDLRVRYTVSGVPCNGITLRCFPVQIFYRLIGTDQIRIFACQWAQQDISGPQS